MRINERLALLKAGYSKDEINAMIDDDLKQVDVKEPEENPVKDDYMKVISALANEVKDLKEAVYTKNISETEVKANVSKSAEDILAELFSAPNKEV